jgi:hypothetical protein
MAEEAALAKSARRCYLVRGVVGLSTGILVGGLLGVLVLILQTGWGKYINEFGDNSPGGIVFGGGGGTAPDFVLILTLVFAVCGAVICGAFGFITGLLTQFWKSRHRQSSPDGVPGEHSDFGAGRV